ncbi:phospholipid-binding protein, PBP family [Chitinophaga sp. CF118]|uniref:YbhB/YbcL family Raf kinase inhibitor-like protein n=1 Tax=Chitinophaga sp. CF118 TaxID=1884367 RepID=UPI0008E5B8C0|nr:YbhB/YbcL family Raf kinase inhibitor-like protein [Chitinophaga sp. CF118]SFE44553.1 phospholipid-binding protein, PBP family [Chitinophaga sp. CF118]
METLSISSSAFQEAGVIPLKYTCDGEEINPAIKIENIPQGTSTLALIVEDPDAPNGTFDHWLVWNIAPTDCIKENTVPGIVGKNGAGKTNYYGPCPPSGYHRYFFNVFALDSSLELEAGADKKALQEAMGDHIIAKGSLMGRFQRVRMKA